MMQQSDYNKEYYDLDPEELWVYNKLELSRKLGYLCGPVGVDVLYPGWYIVRPAINFQGLGLGAKKVWLDKSTDHLPAGHFWCEWFQGTHYSVDYEYAKRVRTTIGIPSDDITKWKKWEVIDRDILFPHLLFQFRNKPNVNVEYINGKLIEVQLRKNPDFSYNNNVFIPVWEGDVIDTPVGYRYIDCPDLNGRIGAYVDTT